MARSFKVDIRKQYRRFANEVGETLVETLVSVLVAGLSILMMFVAIQTASNIVSNTDKAAEKYYEKTNALADFSVARNTSNGFVLVTSNIGNSNNTDGSVSVTFSTETLLGGKTGISYEV